jgi:hypothetical protein
MVTRSPLTVAGEHIARQMIVRALDNATKPDTSTIAEVTGLPGAHITRLVDQAVHDRRPVISQGMRQAVLLRLADQLTAQADVLRRLARDLPIELDQTTGPMCTACGRVFPQRQALATHITRTHRTQERP